MLKGSVTIFPRSRYTNVTVIVYILAGNASILGFTILFSSGRTQPSRISSGKNSKQSFQVSAYSVKPNALVEKPPSSSNSLGSYRNSFLQVLNASHGKGEEIKDVMAEVEN